MPFVDRRSVHLCFCEIPCEEEANKFKTFTWNPAVSASFKMSDCVSYQVENIHKQFNSKISSMNDELCALQLVRIKIIKELTIHNVNKSVSGRSNIYSRCSRFFVSK